MDFLDEVPEHGFGYFEVGDDAVLEWADGDDVARGAAEHAFGVVAYGEDFAGAAFDGDDRGFAEDDAGILDVDEGIGGAEVDADVIGEPAEEFSEEGNHGREKGERGGKE